MEDRQFQRKLQNLELYFYKAKTNITYFYGNRRETERLVKYLKQDLLGNKKTEDTFIACYKMMRNQIKDYIGVNPGTYGDIVGKNDWRTCTHMIKIGFSAKPRLLAFLDAATYYPEVWTDLIDQWHTKSGKEIMKLLNQVSAGTSDFHRREIETVIMNQWAVDFFQEIFRTKIRDYQFTGNVTVDIICDANYYHKENDNIYTKFYFWIKESLIDTCAVVKHFGTPKKLSVPAAGRKSTDGSGQSSACTRLLNTLQYWEEGTVFTLHDLARASNVKLSTLYVELSRNDALKWVLDSMKLVYVKLKGDLVNGDEKNKGRKAVHYCLHKDIFL